MKKLEDEIKKLEEQKVQLKGQLDQMVKTRNQLDEEIQKQVTDYNAVNKSIQILQGIVGDTEKK